MWSIEDIEALNPTESNQSDSFLHHVLNIVAASEEMLCDAALLLEERGSPYVIGFAQLPFLISCGNSFVQVPGLRDGLMLELSFRPTQVTISETGRLTRPSTETSSESDASCTWYTQVIAVVRLWNPRAKLHKAYMNCVSYTGFRNEVIGRVEGWMDMPEARLSAPSRRYAPLSAHAFQTEVTRRIRREIHGAIRKFVRAYCVANLLEHPDVSCLYGYFSMVAPGRLACASPPIPIAARLLSRSSDTPGPKVDLERITSLLDSANITALDDRVLGQLMAMNRLLQQGEPELALIGCVTAVEWFLNDRFGSLVLPIRSSWPRSASISVCLRSRALDFLEPDLQAQLLELSHARNTVVHGPPPSRTLRSGQATLHNTTVSKEFVADGLYLALALYRAVNVHHQETRDLNDGAQLSAPGDGLQA